MLFSVFPGGAGSAASGGGGDGLELFDFPLTIDEYPPDGVGQGRREGHIWLVMTKERAAAVHTVLFDGYGRTTGYTPGTLLLIVPKLGKSKIYVNRMKNTGAKSTPLVYQPEETELETHWPVTLQTQDGVQARVEISRPEGHAKLITETGWENIPIYYFNGKEWEAPETWDYVYWDMTRDTSSGIDTKWQAFKMDTETFLPIRKKVPELSLWDIANTIRIANGNTEPQSNLTIFSGGWAVLGLVQYGQGSNGDTRYDTAYLTRTGRRFLFDGINPHWYFLKISKKQVSYIGQMQFAAEDGKFPYQVVTVSNSKMDGIKKQRPGLGVFYQYASVEKGLPTHICFRRYSCNPERDAVTFWETNPAMLNQTLLEAVYLDDNSGYLLTVDALSPVASASNRSRTLYIHYYRIQGDMLVLQRTSFSDSITSDEGVHNVYGTMNLQSDKLCGPFVTGKYGTSYACLNNYVYTIYEDKTTFYRLWDGKQKSFPYINGDGTKFRVQSSTANQILEYELVTSTPGVVSWKELPVVGGASITQSGNYNRDYYYPHFTKNLPGAREDEVVWQSTSIQKVAPGNPNALLDVNAFGLSGMAGYAVVGGLGNLAVSSQLPDQ